MFTASKGSSKLLKLFKSAFSILMYVAIFVAVVALVLTLILVFVNVSVDDMLLPPFMKKITDDGEVVIEYIISLGNGVKISVPAEKVTLDDIKKVLTAGLFVLTAAMLTLGTLFKFLSMLTANFADNSFFINKNARLIMYMGLTVFIGNTFISFISNFYNYYLMARFIKDTSQRIELSLGINVVSGLTGLLIIFIGFLFNYICLYMNNPEKNTKA